MEPSIPRVGHTLASLQDNNGLDLPEACCFCLRLYWPDQIKQTNKQNNKQLLIYRKDELLLTSLVTGGSDSLAHWRTLVSPTSNVSNNREANEDAVRRPLSLSLPDGCGSCMLPRTFCSVPDFLAMANYRASILTTMFRH